MQEIRLAAIIGTLAEHVAELHTGCFEDRCQVCYDLQEADKYLQERLNVGTTAVTGIGN